MPTPLLVAHRGFSAAHPEMTLAAYQAAIDWVRRTGVPLGLECDVHFSADDQLICLHDLTVDRTSDRTGPAFERTVAELKEIDFGARRDRPTTPAERTLVTLVELLDLVQQAREEGLPVGLVIETKHPNPRGLEVEDQVAALLGERGWDGPEGPCRVITFSEAGVLRLAELLPSVPRSFLIDQQYGVWGDGTLPPGVTVVGPDLVLLERDPGFPARAHARGHQVHAWTVNTPADVQFCLDLGITGLTTDVPDLVHEVLSRSADAPLGPTGQDQ